MGIGRFAYTIKASNHSFNVFDAIFDRITGKNRGYDPAGISMGRARDTDNPYVRPRSILSQVGNAAAEFAAAQVLGQSARAQVSQIPQPVPQTFAATGPGRLEPLVQEGTQTMSLDLGNLLGNLGSQYISARWGTPKQPQVTAPTIRPQGPMAGLARPVDYDLLPSWGDMYQYGKDLLTPEQQQQLPMPGGVQITGNCPPPSYCVDGKTGKVTIKQKRRRRRRLATSSDIRDLSSLKSVLSPADLKMWIATHPS